MQERAMELRGRKRRVDEVTREKERGARVCLIIASQLVEVKGVAECVLEVLESALRAWPSDVTVAEPFLFNLSTVYELRSATTAAKRQLLVEGACELGTMFTTVSIW
ncbi:hypothetical protein PUNSTDRAFT_136758 [Punctularia strigosozonata HHB-11173 SS5]|uniref:uncharacterized protein n=1 Tax=Punctularia strigosozonata (strain HHB-11173) TaxID=741275 RepID=UPI00044180DE|nr:uncharacterized protein PUNSTDRAFT_136758 [Punctularia strigosozonata HHB-11173 SS5]EIN05958.1 hypothetical protein PUNSTDRAFT_136758 [Punctularia strigosozonata HHB-11173 SS5]